MARARTVQLSSKVLRSLSATFIWVAAVTGVFGLLTGSYVSGVASIILAILLLGVVIEGSLLRRLANREVPLASVVLVTVVVILIALSELINLLVTKPTLTVSYVFDALYSVGFLALGSYSTFLLLNHNRE